MPALLDKPAGGTSTALAEPLGSEEARDLFLPEARAIPKSEVRAFRADASIAYHNVVTGLSAVLVHEARIADELPKAGIPMLRTLPQLALGVVFSAAQVDRSTGSPGKVNKLLKEAGKVRDVMLSSAVSLKKAGVLPARAVERIEENRGPIDRAQDCVDLAALFRKYAPAVKGKTVVTAEHIKTADQVGTELLTLLKRKTANKTKGAPSAAALAADERDRLWTLLQQRYFELMRVGGWLWGDRVTDHVPPLQSQAAPRRKKGPAQGGPTQGGTSGPQSPG